MLGIENHVIHAFSVWDASWGYYDKPSMQYLYIVG